MFRLPEEYRGVFKAPFGDLYSDLSDVLPLLEERTVYTVGDVVTHNLILRGISPEIAIIDGHTMRVPCNRTPILLAPRKSVENPPGTITEALIEVIGEAVANPPMLIYVEGEEDLAVIPLVIAAPLSSIILYGQPGEGVVVREVDAESKSTAQQMFSLFEYIEMTSG